MPYTSDAIKALLKQGDNERMEFVPSIRDAATLAKTVCAFGNAGGGLLIVGVGPLGEIIGADPAHIGRLFHGALAATINAPRVDLEATELDDKQVVTITIGKADRLVSTEEGVFRRSGQADSLMSPSDVAAAVTRLGQVAPSVDLPQERGGWGRVDRQTARAQRSLGTATTEEDFQGVGLLCREALISLGQAVYDPTRHQSAVNVTPSETDASRMLEAFIATELAGGPQEELRRHSKSALALALSLQHRRTADYLHAALSLEAVKAVINVVALVSGRRSAQVNPPEPIEPFHIPRMNDPELERISAHYRALGREPVLPKIEKRDVKLARGYEIAKYPGTGREVWVGHLGDSYEHLLMLKPRDS